MGVFVILGVRTMNLKPCPRCGYAGGLIYCNKCHGEYEKNPLVPRTLSIAQEQLFSHLGRPKYTPVTDESEKR